MQGKWTCSFGELGASLLPRSSKFKMAVDEDPAKSAYSRLSIVIESSVICIMDKNNIMY